MKHRMLLFAIVFLALVLRFWQLGKVPASPDWDEAALGYNAYSILKTGRDEYGTFLPRALRSFDDYKPPLYAYLTIPSVALFGLHTWAVRLPSAVMGVLAVIGTYYLVRELFRTQSSKANDQIKFNVQRSNRMDIDLSFGFWHLTLREAAAMLSSLLLAISPWHLQFSRIAFEANTGVTLNIWGLVAFFRGLTSLPWMMASAFLFGLSLYAYHSERIFVPLLLLLVAILWRKDVFADRRRVIIPIVVGLLTVAPLLPVIVDKTSVIRLKGTSSLSDQTGLLMRSVAKLADDQRAGNALGAFLENRRFVYARTIVDGYLSHFSLRWLFLTGDNDRHHAPDNGLLYLWELPFLLWGIFAVWKRADRLAHLLLAWLLIAPVAASPTSETPHAIRTLVVLPALQIFIAFGVLSAMQCFRGSARKAAAVIGFCYAVFILLNIAYYFHMYYGHMNHEYSKFWQYGYEQAVRYAQERKGTYQKIVVSTTLEQPHMFFLFYTNYDPRAYLAHGGTQSGGFAEVRNSFDIYEFRPIPNWSQEKHDGKTLYIGSPKELPGDVYTIKYLNGEDAIRISE